MNQTIDLQRLSAGLPQPQQPVNFIVRPRELQGAEPLNPPATVGSPLDVKLLQGSEKEIVQLTVTNTDPLTQNLIIGSELGIAGNFTRYGRTPSACDNPLVSDQNGANVQKTQGVSALWNSHSALVTDIQIFTTNALQRAVRMERIVFNANGDDCNRQGRIPMSNTEDNFVEYTGPFAFGNKWGLSYPVLTGQTVDIQLNIAANASVEGFSQA